MDVEAELKRLREDVDALLGMCAAQMQVMVAVHAVLMNLHAYQERIRKMSADMASGGSLFLPMNDRALEKYEEALRAFVGSGDPPPQPGNA